MVTDPCIKAAPSSGIDTVDGGVIGDTVFDDISTYTPFP
jgi:hypothetical protein